MPIDPDERLNRFEGTLGELRGEVRSLEAQVARLLDRPVSQELDKHSGLKTAVTYASIVIVPILVSILGGYFALKAAGLR